MLTLSNFTQDQIDELYDNFTAPTAPPWSNQWINQGDLAINFNIIGASNSYGVHRALMNIFTHGVLATGVRVYGPNGKDSGYHAMTSSWEYDFGLEVFGFSDNGNGLYTATLTKKPVPFGLGYAGLFTLDESWQIVLYKSTLSMIDVTLYGDNQEQLSVNANVALVV